MLFNVAEPFAPLEVSVQIPPKPPSVVPSKQRILFCPGAVETFGGVGAAAKAIPLTNKLAKIEAPKNTDFDVIFIFCV